MLTLANTVCHMKLLGPEKNATLCFLVGAVFLKTV
jgi:hypothetical protein